MSLCVYSGEAEAKKKKKKLQTPPRESTCQHHPPRYRPKEIVDAADDARYSEKRHDKHLYSYELLRCIWQVE